MIERRSSLFMILVRCVSAVLMLIFIFVALAFGEQLHDLAFPRGQAAAAGALDRFVALRLERGSPHIFLFENFRHGASGQHFAQSVR